MNNEEQQHLKKLTKAQLIDLVLQARRSTKRAEDRAREHYDKIGELRRELDAAKRRIAEMEHELARIDILIGHRGLSSMCGPGWNGRKWVGEKVGE